MSHETDLTPAEIRQAHSTHAKLRARDLAAKLGIREAQLVAAFAGQTATRIASHPDEVMAAAQKLGPVMALTRNESCVHEVAGIYQGYYSGAHACMVLGPVVDLRLFPSHWHYGFAVEKDTGQGVQRSLQIFDTAGDAIHKIYLTLESSQAVWAEVVAALAQADQSQTLTPEPRKPTEAAKSALNKCEALRKEWGRMTDTHQFLRLTSKLKMNRLGAYRIAGDPFVRPLPVQAVDQMLNLVKADGLEVMLFVGNRGCIQIHTGPIGSLTPMGPWQNVTDPEFNLHLRLDHVKEVWCVNKPTQRGTAVSVEAFDADGGLIFQIFGLSKEGRDSRPAWQVIVDQLPTLTQQGAA